MTFELPNGLPEGPWSLKTSPYYFSIADIKGGFVCQISRSDEREPIAIAIASIPDMVEEIGRLRTENERVLTEIIGVRGRYIAENESLRAFNAEIREKAQAVVEASDEFTAGMQPEWDGDPLTDVVEELRAILAKSQETSE